MEFLRSFLVRLFAREPFRLFSQANFSTSFSGFWLRHNMHSSRLGKSSKWYNEKRFKKVMALNRKEESLLQQKLDQIQREESFLQREYKSKIVKTAQALNARENDGRKISSTTARGRCELRFRGKSSSPLFMKLPNPEILKRRRHTVAGLTSIINKASDGEKKSYFSKASDSDVLSAIDNSFKFMSIACESKPRLTASPKAVKLPEISLHSANAPYGSHFSKVCSKAALMRRRHSDVTSLRHRFKRLGSEDRHSSLGNILENSK